MKTPTTTTAQAPAAITPRSIKAANRHQAAALAARLKDVPPAELVEMILDAGLDAVNTALDSHGALILPLALSLNQGDTLPIQLPAPIAAKLRAMAEAAGIEGGADSFAAAILGDMLEDTAADLLIDGWEITDPATIAELYRIQSGSAKIQPIPNCPPRVMESAPAPADIPGLRGLHYNSNAYAQTMAAFLREHCQSEAEAARWYRTIRNREIPAAPAAFQ